MDNAVCVEHSKERSKKNKPTERNLENSAKALYLISREHSSDHEMTVCLLHSSPQHARKVSIFQSPKKALEDGINVPETNKYIC